MSEELKKAVKRIEALEEEVSELRKLMRKLTARMEGLDSGFGGVLVSWVTG